MGEEPEPLVSVRDLSIDPRLIAPATVFGDGARDGVVQALVQHVKVGRADVRAPFHRQLRDGLADVAIVVHDLRYGEPLHQEIVAVKECGPGNFRIGGVSEA